MTRPAHLSVLMPASFQPPTHQKRDENRKRDETTPPAPVIVIPDDDEPLGDTEKPKGSAKKARVYTPEEEAARQEDHNKLHSDCRQLQYANEFENFKVYWNSIKNLRGAPNMDDHTEYLQDHVLKNQKQSYSCAGNLLTVKAFQKKLQKECKDTEKVARIERKLGHRGLPGVPEDTMVDGKRYKLLTRYVMRVLQSCDGTIVDSHHTDWGRDQNIGLYDIISPMSMAKLEWSGTARLHGKPLPIKVSHGYCPMCSYASENHRTLNNHVRLHFRMTMVCGFPDCWEVCHNATTMWTHARTHGFTVSEPCAMRPLAKKK